jgi:predicted nucleic acid-binding protein
MVIHLDTSLLVDVLREQARRRHGPATAFIEEHADDTIGLSAFVVCELEAGAARAADPERERARVRGLLQTLAVAFPDERFAPTYAELLRRVARGRTVSTMDLLIATSAVVDDVPLATRNRRHFDDVPGLRVLTY